MEDVKSGALFSPGILSIIPILYVGWSDSILSPSEIRLVNNQIQNLSFLTESDRVYIKKYTDPLNPPTEAVFRDWINAMKEASHKLPKNKVKSLISLGLEMAKSSIGFKSEELWDAIATKESLMEVQEALGVQFEDSERMLLSKINLDSMEPPKRNSFNVIKLQRILDGEHGSLKSKLKKLLRDPFFRMGFEPNKEIQRENVLSQLKSLADQGFTRYAFPKAFGGLSKPGQHIAVFETLAFHDLSLSVKLGVQMGLYGGAIHGLGTELHHKRYLPPAITMDELGCFAMTETNHGSNVRQLETTAIYNHTTRTFTINTPHVKAGKEYIGNALHCHKAVVFAQLIIEGESKGVHAFIVDMRDESGNLYDGIRVEDCGYKMGLNGVDNGKIWFKDVIIPVGHLLNKYGDISPKGTYVSEIKSDDKRFFTMLGALVTGRVSVGLAGISASKSALAIAVKYSLRRRQFAAKDGDQERLIMDYPTHQHRLIPLIAESYAYSFALNTLAKELVEDTEHKNRRKIETDAAGLKAMASWFATSCIQETREACGGKGYLVENKFTALKGDSDIFTTFEGDNTVLLQLVAKGLLTKFKKSFHDGGFSMVMRYIGGQISQKFNELNPIYTRNVDMDHLRDRVFHMDAFEYREKKILYSVSQRMQSFIKKKVDPYEAYLKCQMHLIELAKAYVERLVLKRFEAKIESLPSSKEKQILIKLCDLYAVHTINKNKGWYLENDFISGVKSKALRKLESKLLQELRPDVGGLVDAFGIPEELLDAEILK